MLGDLLDNGDIDYAVLDALEGFTRIKLGRTLSISTEYARQEFMKLNMIRALLDLNIIFKSKYYDQISLEHGFYYPVLTRYVN